MIFTQYGVPVEVVGARRLRTGGIEVDCNSTEGDWAGVRNVKELKADGGIKEILKAAEPFLKEQA